MSGNELHGPIGEKVGRKRLGVSPLDRIGRLVVLARFDARPVGRHLQLLPMPSIEHVSVVGEPELALRRPLGLACPVQVPLAGVAGRVPAAAQQLGECHDIV